MRALGEKSGAERVVLFGSRARGDNNDTSDFDIAFFGITDTRIKLDIIGECEMDAPTLKKIDVSFGDELGEKFLQNIKKEGIVLYERNKN